MHVLLSTVGSRGDVQPYVALGAGLQAAGHRATLNAGARFEPFAREHGLGFAPLADDLLDLIDAQAGLIEDMGELRTAIPTGIRLARETKGIQRALVADGWAAAREADPDLIVYHFKMSGAVDYAEALGVPAVLGALVAQLVPTASFPTVGLPAGPGLYNRATYRLTLSVARRFLAPYLRGWRAERGLPPRRTDVLHTTAGDPVPVLHAISPHVVPPPPDWPETATMTGYWFLDARDQALSPDLDAFLDAGDPPVYVGFGSMPSRHPERLAAVVVEALGRAGVRGVLASGWGGLAPGDLPPTVHLIESAPHDALLPRVAAVVHHGGAGTTAAGLRAGRPTVVCPFFGDQPFWGSRVEALGVGPPPLPRKRLRADRLAAAISEVVTNASMRHRAEKLGRAIRAEDGVGTAVRDLEQIRAAHPAAA